MSAGEPEISIVLTGVVGSGKSATCNFFFREDIFTSDMSFSPVTVETDFCVQMVGGKLTKFVDTPGLLDPNNTTPQQYKRVARAILAVPNGIHALGIVIKIGDRITAENVRLLEQLLFYIELIPYTFVIFTNACQLGSTAHGKQQQHKFECLLNKAPPILRQLLETIGQRYIILESVLNKEQDYYDTKVDELMKIVQSILAKQKKPFTCFLNNLARQLLASDVTQKERIDALEIDLLRVQKEKERNFWKSFFMFTGAVVGAAAGGAVGAGLGASAVAAIVGGSTFAGGAAGIGVVKVYECHNQ